MSVVDNQYKKMWSLGKWDYLIVCGKQKGELYGDNCMGGDLPHILSSIGCILYNIAKNQGITSEQMGDVVNKAYELQRIQEEEPENYSKALHEFYGMFVECGREYKGE